MAYDRPKGPSPPAWVQAGWGWTVQCEERPSRGAAWERAVGRRPAICQLPAPSSRALPRPAVSARGQGAGQARRGRSQAGRDRCAGGLSGQVALSGLGGCLERMRQTDGVTLKSPRAWLGATRSRPDPLWQPPTLAALIRFLP